MPADRTMFRLGLLIVVSLVWGLAGCGGKSSAPVPQAASPARNPGPPRTTIAGPQATLVKQTAGVVAVTVKPQQPVSAPSFAGNVALRTPSSLPASQNTTRRASDTNTLRTRQASGFDTSLPLQGVNADFASAEFNPNWTPQAPVQNRLAFATYRISATGYTGLPTIGITWVAGLGPQNFSDYFVAVANRALDRWEWFEGPIDDVITLSSLAPYTAANGDVLVMVLLTGTTPPPPAPPYTLSGVSMGPEETRGTNGGQDLFGGGGSGSDDGPPLFGGTLPASVDLSPLCAPIRNQGTLGSCTAFAVGDGAMNYEMRRIYGDRGWDFSGENEKIGPRYLYVETGKVQSLPCSEEGRDYYGVVSWLKQNGIPLESNAPYLPTPCNDAWSQTTLGDAAVLKPIRAETVPCNTDAGITQVKTLLAQGRVVPFGTTLDQAFMTWTPQQQPWTYAGPPNGGHAMCIVGYDDAKQAFKVRNSWGEEWGDNGHVFISYNSLKTPGILAVCFLIELEQSQAVLDRFFGGGGGGFSPPTGVSATDGTHTDKITISWNAAAGATGYKLFRDNQATPLQTLGAVTTFDDTAAADGFSHTYWVKATKPGSESGFSASDSGYAGGGSDAPVIYGVQYVEGGVGDPTQFFVDYYSGTSATFSWTLGGCNPGSSAAESPTATFATPGVQTISITVTNGSGADTLTGEIYIGGGGGGPVAVLTGGPTSGTALLEVTLDASGSTDDQGISQFDWDWEGDGTFDYSSGLYSIINVSFPAGTWNTTVRVWDYEGFSDDAILPITVTGGSQGSLTELEDNDNFAQATAINFGSTDLGSCGGGSGYPGYDGDLDDYWGLQVTGAPVTFEVDMNLNSSTGDLDLYIYDQAGVLGGWSESNGPFESIIVNLPVGFYYIRVHSFSGFSDYDLTYGAF